jgi:hypothetical protein
MKTSISMFLVFFATLGSYQFGYAAGNRISNENSSVLTTVFQQLGFQIEPSILSSRGFMRSDGIRCVLEKQTPDNLFKPDCKIQDRSGEKYSANEDQLRTLIGTLILIGARPVNEGTDVVLTTGEIHCQLDGDMPVVSTCYAY